MFGTSGVFLVMLRLQSTFSLGEESNGLDPPGSTAAPAPLVEGRGALLAGEKGGMEPFVNVQQVLPLTANDSNAQIKTFRRRLAWLKLVLRLPQPVPLLLGGLSHDPGLRTR